MSSAHAKPGKRPAFKLEWDLAETVCEFKTSQTLPYSWRERGRIGKTMTVDDILSTSEPAQNPDVRRKRKWKEISHFFSMTRKPEYSHKSLEKALFIYGVDTPLSLNNFVMAVMHEYKFSNDMGMDNHLRFLYWSLEGGQDDAADWRELAACMKASYRPYYY